MGKNKGDSDQGVSAKKFGYARVSTVEQNLDLQIQALKDAGCEEIWSEKKSASARREQFELMIKHLRPGDIVVVWKLDRLARSMKDLMEWGEKFQQWGVELQCLTQPVDTTTPMGKAFFNLMGVFAQLEQDMISERTKAGMEAAKKRGGVFGKKTKITGKKREAMARDIQDLTMTMKEVAKKHGYKSLTTLNRHFKGLRKEAIMAARLLDEQEEKDDE